jgi:hypothetical protein
MRRSISALGVVALMLAARAAGAQSPPPPCDFLTGGGYIFNSLNNRSRANFGVGGSCKKGGDSHGLWGHLEYVDHDGFLGTAPFDVHWTTITAYSFVDPNTRRICGTARTNLPSPNDTVNWVVTATDNEGSTDMFMIQVVGPTMSYLTGDEPLAGGVIEIHQPNPSTTTDSTNCPALGMCPTGEFFCPFSNQCQMTGTRCQVD